MDVKKRRTTITIERHEITILRKQHSSSILCVRCRSVVNALSIKEKADLFGVPAEEITGSATAGEIHFSNTSDAVFAADLEQVTPE